MSTSHKTKHSCLVSVVLRSLDILRITKLILSASLSISSSSSVSILCWSSNSSLMTTAVWCRRSAESASSSNCSSCCCSSTWWWLEWESMKVRFLAWRFVEVAEETWLVWGEEEICCAKVFWIPWTVLVVSSRNRFLCCNWAGVTWNLVGFFSTTCMVVLISSRSKVICRSSGTNSSSKSLSEFDDLINDSRINKSQCWQRCAVLPQVVRRRRCVWCVICSFQ